MSGFDGGQSAHRGMISPREFTRKPVISNHAAGLGRSPGADSAVQAGTSYPFPQPTHSAPREQYEIVSPTSTSRDDTASSPREEHRADYGVHDHPDVPTTAQQHHDWHSLPSPPALQPQQSEEIHSPSATGSSPGHWRQSYHTEHAGDAWQETHRSRVSWQAAPHMQTSSQSPPNPNYQEIAASVSQRQGDMEQDMSPRVLPSREASWLGRVIHEQEPHPSYNELASASNHKRNSREQTPILEEGGPWQGDPGSSLAQHPKYREVPIEAAGPSMQEVEEDQQEELPAGAIANPLYQDEPFPSAQMEEPGSREEEQYELAPVATPSWHASPTIPTPQEGSLRLEIPTPPAHQSRGSHRHLAIESSRQESRRSAAVSSTRPIRNSSEQPQESLRQPSRVHGSGQEQRQDQITPVNEMYYTYQEQSPQGQAQTRSGGDRGPFMHYEDYTFFDPNGSPKDELQARGIRATNTFSTTVPDSAIRRQARHSWGRQRRKQSGSRERDERSTDPNQGGSSTRDYILPWLPEIVWCLLSVACFFIIVAVLRVYNGCTLPEWPLGITLNTLIAFFAAMCQAAFIVPLMEGLSQLKWNWFVRGERPLADFVAFENASRNPIGWAQLLFMARGRALGVCAALVLLTSLVTSPVTQLLITYPTRSVSTAANTSVASVPRSEVYYFPDADSEAPDLEIHQKRAIHEGIYHHPSEKVPHISPTCGTNECQWDRFSSLAVCAFTTDISDRLILSGQTTPSHQQRDDVGKGNKGLVRKASLPSGLSLAGGTDALHLIMSTTEASEAILSPPATRSTHLLTKSGDAESPITNVSIIYTDQASTDDTSEPWGFRAAEVTLQFCVNTYQVTVSEGIAVTSIVDSTTSSEAINRPGSDGKIYSISAHHANALRDYVESVFVGTYSSRRGVGTARATAASDALGTAMYNGKRIRGRAESELGGDGMAVIDNVMQNVATSLTNVIRSSGTTQAAAAVLATESYIQVRWRWLAFPAAQVFLATAFLAGVMAQTAIWKTKVLKGSTVATLFAIGAEDKVLLERQNMGIVSDGAEMDRQAGRITGQLIMGRNGWALNLGRHGAGVIT